MIRFPTIDTPPRERFRLAHSLFLISKMPEAAEVLQWFESELDRMDVENRFEPDPVVFRQRQGACQCLTILLREIKEASKKADNIQAEMKPAYQL